MKSSYSIDDVIILLKDITGLVEPLDNETREKNIQSGIHYSEMLPKESLPSEEYRSTFLLALDRYAVPTARAVKVLGDKIISSKGSGVVLVSLARAGTPIGILLKRYIKSAYKLDVPHYTISIIRGKGIDSNAMNYILSRHSPEQIQFVDGWTGKGAIQNQLKEAMKEYRNIDDRIAVLSDPAYVSGICGTHNDFLIPSSCLNSTVSGLISRTFYRPDIIKKDDFHGAMYYGEFKNEDFTELFLSKIQSEFDTPFSFAENENDHGSPQTEVSSIAKKYNIHDINLIKPGLGETTRVLLRRIPWKILVHSLNDYEHLGHIYQLAKEKRADLEVYPFKYYRACGLIKELSDT